MRRRVVVSALLWGMLASVVSAGYVIDGSLSDWGVTPFVSWAPGGTADYTQTDNVNLYNAEGYAELFDFEAMYFDNDATKFYFAVVGSYPMNLAGGIGDLGIDLNHDMTVSPHGIVTGLEYAIRVGTPTPGDVVLDPLWTHTSYYQWLDGWQGSPFWAEGGTTVGTASIAVQYYPGLEDGTYILEASVDRSLFPGNGGNVGDVVGSHLTQFCGNDSINLFGIIDPGPPPTPIPAPAALLLACLGTAIVGGLRRHKVM